MNETRRIICICSGNICRSPMAVALLRQKLSRRAIAAVVISAGTLGIQGRRASPFARAAVVERDPDLAAIIDEHRSQGLSRGMVEMADHLLVMAPRHEQFIRRMRLPAASRRIVRLWEHARGNPPLGKIPDPVGRDADVFRHCCQLIDSGLDHWLDEAFPQNDSTSEQEV